MELRSQIRLEMLEESEFIRRDIQHVRVIIAHVNGKYQCSSVNCIFIVGKGLGCPYDPQKQQRWRQVDPGRGFEWWTGPETHDPDQDKQIKVVKSRFSTFKLQDLERLLRNHIFNPSGLSTGFLVFQLQLCAHLSWKRQHEQIRSSVFGTICYKYDVFTDKWEEKYSDITWALTLLMWNSRRLM